MNGTMEEPMETSLPNSPVKESSQIDNEDTSNNCENSNNEDINNHLDSQSDLEAVHNSHVDNRNESSVNSNNHVLPECTTETTKALPVQENSINITIENHCVNSNDSHIESTASPQGQSDDTIKQNNAEKDTPKESKHQNIKYNLNNIANIHTEESEEIDSEDDSSDEEGSEISGERKADDTVSINSDSDPDGGDETSQESNMKNRNSDIILVDESRTETHNGDSCHSPEIHEIESDNDDNDDCIMAEEPLSSKVSENKVQLRRSSRTIKRKRYTDDIENGDESDIEEIGLRDPLSRKSRPIVISDTKALVEMAAKQMKCYSNNQKKEPTVVIIDTNSIISGKSSTQQSKNSTSMSSLSAQSLYQSIVARGTTVTPVSSKASVTQSSQSAQPPILPSLTDDMFVVEAPSFIVPYVYEKPSVKPFREFVDVLGKELEEQRAKEEKEQLEKEKDEKEKRDKERQEKKSRGEEVEESEEENDAKAETVDPAAKPDVEDEEEKKKKKSEKKKERRRRQNDDDDASWDGESSTDSDDEILSDEEAKTVVIKDKADSIEEIKDVSDLTADKVCTGKSDNYFDCSLGKFFINIGLNLVQEFVQTDLLKQQNRKLYREKKSGHSTKATETSIASLMKNLEFSKENNAPYSFPQKKCESCSFKSESMLTMAHHLETPHMKNNVYKCNFCTFEIRSPHDILYHMEAEHNIRGKLERAPAYHQCANCPFEDNGKGKLARHLIPCAKKFKPDLNLAPPVEWEPPAKIPKIARSRNNMMSTYQNSFGRNQIGGNLGRPMNMASMISGIASTYRPRVRSPMSVPPRGTPIHGVPIMRGGAVVRHNTPNHNLMSSNFPIANNGKPKSMHQPSISITPLPRHPQPVVSQPTQQSKSAFVICEICDGYIKDLEQLRNHMQWIHKVKIHPKMIYNRPPLNCQKCQFRFFTDQGLERHLLGSHGLVTSSMQEAANKGKDAGRCPVCGRVYQWKLLNHVARDHNLTLKPAHLSYKCTVCTATFGMYKQFENHVYSAHSVVAKRVMDKSKASASTKPANDSLLKPLKINDEITIIPQPAKPTTPTPAKEK